MMMMPCLVFAAYVAAPIPVASWESLRAVIAAAKPAVAVSVQFSPAFTFNESDYGPPTPGKENPWEIGIADGRTVSINGGGHTLTGRGGDGRFLNITDAHVELTDLNFNSGGCIGDGGFIAVARSILKTSYVTFNQAAVWPSRGGAIWAEDSELSLGISTMFRGCSAGEGGALAAFNTTIDATDTVFIENSVDGAGDAPGGAMLLAGCNVTISRSTFSQGGCDGGGGAIVLGDCTATIDQTDFSENMAGGGSSGGALDITNSHVVVTGSTFTNNQASGGDMGLGGGAITVTGSQLTVRASNFTGNSASVNGGAIAEGPAESGCSEVHISGCFFDSNTARDAGNTGGAIFSGDGNVTVDGCMCRNNQPQNFGGNFTAKCSPY